MLLVGPIQRSKGRDQTKRDPPGPPGWKFGIVITMPHTEKLIVTVTRSINNDRDNTNWNREQVLVREHYSLMHLLGRQDMIVMMIPELQLPKIRAISRAGKMAPFSDKVSTTESFNFSSLSGVLLFICSPV